MKNAIIGVAATQKHADEIVKELIARGVPSEDIWVAPAELSEADAAREKLSARAAMGASSGAVLAGVAGLIYGTQNSIVPWDTSFTVLGTLLSTAVAGVLGATLGGVVGALVGLRFLRAEESSLRERSEQQTLLVAVKTSNSEAEARAKSAFLGRPGCRVESRLPGGADVQFRASASLPVGARSPLRTMDEPGQIGRRSGA